MKMNITQDIKQVVSVISELRKLYDNDEEIPIHPKEDLSSIPEHRIHLILKRLDKKEWAIQYVQPPLPQSFQLDNPDRWFQCYIVKLLPWFDDYVDSLLKPIPEKVVFDDNAPALKSGEKTIRLKYDTKQYDLIKTLFKKPTKKWSKDEIEEIYGIEWGKGKREVYDAVKKINSKVNEKFDISDFIFTQNKAIWLNSKYLI